MRRSFTLTVPAVAAAAAVALATAAGPAGATAPPTTGERPTKVVIILVDALSTEIVEKYDMDNVQALMDDYVDTPRGYLGHVGSVTVVTHNVLTTGLLPKNMGWSDDGYRDTTNLLGGTNPFWIPSSWSRDDMFTVQESIGKRRLPDYLKAADPAAKTFVVSPKAYAAWAFGGPTADSIITFGSNTNCDGTTRRGPAGVEVPAYLLDPCGRYFVKRSTSLTYDTHQWPASLYPLDGNRYATGHEEDHLGGDIWATDIALDIMDNEEWNGIFLSLPDVDKNAHMWGSIDDAEGAGLLDPDPMTHMEFAARTADEQVGRVMDKLEADGELDNTLVVLTADHGSVPGRDFHGTENHALNYGFYNWYYGTAANDAPYLQPQEALKPLTDTDNVGLSYSDSMLRAWLKDTSAAKVSEAASLMAGMPGVSAVWTRDGDRYARVSPIRWDRMTTPGEKAWFVKHAQELVDTEAAVYGPEVIATLVDDTTYSVAGDHGGIQRRSQEIPIVFAGADLSRTDLQAPVRSVDVMPMVLQHMGIDVDPGLDGVAYTLPTRP